MPKKYCVFHLWEFNDYVNLSAKENTNVESKSKNDSEIQDESQKCEKFTVLLIQYTKTPF